jgi:hypothetical protein
MARLFDGEIAPEVERRWLGREALNPLSIETELAVSMATNAI